jgi:hypothetical protein
MGGGTERQLKKIMRYFKALWEIYGGGDVSNIEF